MSDYEPPELRDLDPGINPLRVLAIATELPEEVTDHLLDVARELKVARDTTPRWRFLTRRRLQTSWLSVVGDVQFIEQSKALQRLSQRRRGEC